MLSISAEAFYTFTDDPGRTGDLVANCHGHDSPAGALDGLSEQLAGEPIPDGANGMEVTLQFEQLTADGLPFWGVTIEDMYFETTNRYKVITSIIGFTHSEEFSGTRTQADRIAEMLMIWNNKFLEYREGMTFLIEPGGAK